MRTVSIITGGGTLGALAVAGTLLISSSESRAVPQTAPPPPDRISLTGAIRDFPPGSVHPDFQVNPSATPGARSALNVSFSLDADKKPVYVGPGRRVNTEWRNNNNEKIAAVQHMRKPQPGDVAGSFQNGNNGNDNGGIQNNSTFCQWFRDVPGVNMSRLWTIHLDRNSSGEYVYSTPDFNPINHQLFGNGFDDKNFYFTYEVVCTFTAAPGQYLEFKGDDDFWMYLVGPQYPAGELVLDHGGIAANREQIVRFDRYGLTAGTEYKLHMFFAERCQPQSQFHLRTNIGSSLRTSNDTSNTIFAAFD